MLTNLKDIPFKRFANRQYGLSQSSPLLMGETFYFPKGKIDNEEKNDAMIEQTTQLRLPETSELKA